MGLRVDTRNRMDSIMMVMVESFTQINSSIACDLNNNVLDYYLKQRYNIGIMPTIDLKY